MPDLEQQLREDRALRDAAKAVLEADLALVKGDVDPKPATSRAIDKARDLADDTAYYASTNKGKVGSGLGLMVAAALAWYFRDRIGKWIHAFLVRDGEP